MEFDQNERSRSCLPELALAVLRETTLADDLKRLCRLTAGLIPLSVAVSVALLIDGEPTTVAVSDRVAIETIWPNTTRVRAHAWRRWMATLSASRSLLPTNDSHTSPCVQRTSESEV